MSSDQSQNESPSMISGHAKYVQGAVSSALGYESGEQTKSDAVNEMRAASDQNNEAPTQNSILGKAEELVGKAVGCEGMEKEGGSRQPNVGIEEANGTG